MSAKDFEIEQKKSDSPQYLKSSGGVRALVSMANDEIKKIY